MLILVPWKPFVFGWLLLTAMILTGYAVYCLQEGRSPFSVEKYHLHRVHTHHAAGLGSTERMRTATVSRRSRHNKAARDTDSGCAVSTATTLNVQNPSY